MVVEVSDTVGCDGVVFNLQCTSNVCVYSVFVRSGGWFISGDKAPRAGGSCGQPIKLIEHGVMLLIDEVNALVMAFRATF